jgi:hypothetical protein
VRNGRAHKNTAGRSWNRWRSAPRLIAAALVVLHVGCSSNPKPSYMVVTCGSREADIAAARRISTAWTMERIVQLLGTPERTIGRAVEEWTCTDGTVIRATASGDYGLPVAAVEFSK